jgi:hypothetical protein
MKSKESRRLVPVAFVAVVTFAVVFVCEALVIGGVFEMRSSTVAKVAPWAYEPFLRLVGEHPDSNWQGPPSPGPQEARSEMTTLDMVKGLRPDAAVEETNGIPEVEPALEPEAEKPAATAETPAAPAKKVVPVG